MTQTQSSPISPDRVTELVKCVFINIFLYNCVVTFYFVLFFFFSFLLLPHFHPSSPAPIYPRASAATAGEICEAAKYLRATGSPKVGAIGFCMGGALTLIGAQHSDDIACAAPFYGRGATACKRYWQTTLFPFYFGGSARYQLGISSVSARHQLGLNSGLNSVSTQCLLGLDSGLKSARRRSTPPAYRGRERR